MFRNFIQKLHLEKYVSSKLILGLDLAISVGVSLFALFITNVLFSSFIYDFKFILYIFGSSLLSSAVFFFLLQTHKSIIRHSTLRELWKLGVAALGKGATMVAIIKFTYPVLLDNVYILTCLLFDILGTISALVAARVVMIISYDILRERHRSHDKRKHILVYGVGSKSVAQIKRLQGSDKYNVVGFLSFGMNMRGHHLANLPVYYFENIDDLKYLVNHKGIDAILFSTQEDAKAEQMRLISYCTELNVKIYIVPVIDEVVDGKVMRSVVREIKIEDLLGRDEIKISLKEIEANFKGKTILVTGAAGSIGSELCRQLATFGVEHLVMFDNAETPMHNIRLELEERFPKLKFTPIIGDVRIVARLDYVFQAFKPQVVFHAAAYKHVPLMEENPCEAVLVNVCGSRNVTDMCLKYDVEKMVMISTDKAVNPTNIMGASKRMCEMIVQSRTDGNTCFAAVRFGNVLGSNGSVIPLFRRLKESGIHICVDTNGSVWNDDVKELLSLADLILLDVKQYNPERHRVLTERSNEQTLRTAEWLESIGKPFWLRYVLVQGYSAIEEDIRALCTHFSPYKMLQRVEILPYHTLGVHKYEAMGKEYKLAGVKENTPAQLDEAKAIFDEYFPKVYIN